MISNNSPCHECKDRAIGCHKGCGKYLAWAESRKKELKALDGSDSWTQAKGNLTARSTRPISTIAKQR